MQKVACIFSFKESNWVSCQKIVFNLHKSYQRCADFELENFNFSDQQSLEELSELANKILQYGPDVISIMDHKPHPLPLFQALVPLLRNHKKPKLLIHLFGDYTLYYPHWDKTLAILDGFEVEFLVASDRQKILVDRMLDGKEAVVCPFPVDPKEFYFDPKSRLEQRKQWGLKPDDVVFLFTGRLSRQKRIKTLVATFAQEFAQEPKAHLFLYGNPDNIGDPFIDRREIEGEYFRVFYSVYKALPLEIQKRIHFMGAVPNAQLLRVYQGADVLMNLSVHNDEDYGMSVAEAQCTGLCTGLTDWGGLASFNYPSLPLATQYIRVRIATFQKEISRQDVRKVMRAFFENPQGESRELIAQAAQEKFGLGRVTTIMRELAQRKSSGWTGSSALFFRALHASQISNTDSLYLDKNRRINKLYRDIYSAYVRND